MQGYGTDISLLAGEDLSAKQFRFVKVDSNGEAVVCGLGEAAIGILQNNPGDGEAATIRILGKSKFSADAAVAAGALVKSSADGQGATAAKATTNTSDAGAASDALVGSAIMGICTLAAANAGEIGEVVLTHAGAVATTAA